MVKGVLTWVGLVLGVAGIIAFVYGLTVLISHGSCGCDADGFCSGPPCPPSDDLGFVGLFAGIWVAVGGFILMGAARTHARVQQWRSQFGQNSFANMSHAYGTAGSPGLTLGALSSGSIAPGQAAMAGPGISPGLVAELLKVRQENSGNPEAAREATLDVLRSHGYAIPANAPPGSVAVLGGASAVPGGPGFALPGAAAPPLMSAEAVLARDAQAGLPGTQPAAGDAAGRLQELEALKQQGVLNDDEYAAQRKRILDSI